MAQLLGSQRVFERCEGILADNLPSPFATIITLFQRLCNPITTKRIKNEDLEPVLLDILSKAVMKPSPGKLGCA